MAKLDDIRGCKITVGAFSISKMADFILKVKDMGMEFTQTDTNYVFAYISDNGYIAMNSYSGNFNESELKEIFFINSAFHDCDIEKIGSDRPSPVDAGNSIYAVLDHHAGDIVFNKNGFKYKQFLCIHPLDSNVSLCQCDSGDILEVLNSELLSYSENLAIIKAETDNAEKLYNEYVKCVNVKSPMAVMIPFDNMDIEGIKIWIEFAKRVTINEK